MRLSPSVVMVIGVLVISLVFVGCNNDRDSEFSLESLAHEKKWEELRQASLYSLEEEPDDFEAQYYLALSYYRLGETVKAAETALHLYERNSKVAKRDDHLEFFVNVFLAGAQAKSEECTSVGDHLWSDVFLYLKTARDISENQGDLRESVRQEGKKICLEWLDSGGAFSNNEFTERLILAISLAPDEVKLYEEFLQKEDRFNIAARHEIASYLEEACRQNPGLLDESSFQSIRNRVILTVLPLPQLAQQALGFCIQFESGISELELPGTLQRFKELLAEAEPWDGVYAGSLDRAESIELIIRLPHGGSAKVYVGDLTSDVVGLSRAKELNWYLVPEDFSRYVANLQRIACYQGIAEIQPRDREDASKETPIVEECVPPLTVDDIKRKYADNESVEVIHFKEDYALVKDEEGFVHHYDFYNLRTGFKTQVPPDRPAGYSLVRLEEIIDENNILLYSKDGFRWDPPCYVICYRSRPGIKFTMKGVTKFFKLDEQIEMGIGHALVEAVEVVPNGIQVLFGPPEDPAARAAFGACRPAPPIIKTSYNQRTQQFAIDLPGTHISDEIIVNRFEGRGQYLESLDLVESESGSRLVLTLKLPPALYNLSRLPQEGELPLIELSFLDDPITGYLEEDVLVRPKDGRFVSAYEVLDIIGNKLYVWVHVKEIYVEQDEVKPGLEAEFPLVLLKGSGIQQPLLHFKYSEEDNASLGKVHQEIQCIREGNSAVNQRLQTSIQKQVQSCLQ